MTNKSKGVSRNGGSADQKTEAEIPAPSPVTNEQQDAMDNYVINYPLPPVQTPYNFFKQQRSMNYKNYLYMKKQEGPVMKRQMAALCIQTFFRGWLVRSNMQLLTTAAIKIQCLWRRAIARILFLKLSQAREEKRLVEHEKQAATKIQAAWRGYWSRKNKFNFKTFKDLKTRNEALQESAELINELEEILSIEESTTSMPRSSSFSPSEESTHSNTGVDKLSTAEQNKAIEILKHLMAGGDLKDLVGVSPSRVNELVASLLSKDGCICSTSSELLRNPQLLVRRGSMPDSVLQMFPSLPDSDKMVQPNSERVRALKYAIQSLREISKEKESQKLYKLHHLSRTAVLPGVYSDIYSSRFTEMDNKLRSLRFWTPENLIHRIKGKDTANLLVMEEMEIKDEEEMMLEKIYNFNTQYMPPGYELDTMNPKPHLRKKITQRPKFITCFK